MEEATHSCTNSSCHTDVQQCGLRDREDILPLMVHPAQRQLPRRAPFPVCDGLQLFYQLEVLQGPGRVSVAVRWTVQLKSWSAFADIFCTSLKVL